MQAASTLPSLDTMRAWRLKLATAALWVLIALAAAGGLRALLWGGSPAEGRSPAAAPSGVSGFAELYVAAYLEAGSGQEQTLRAYYPGSVDLHDVTPSGRYASHAATVTTSESAPGYWVVTVGAEVLVAAQGGYVRAGTHYYRVGVMTGSGALVATSLPAEVPAPTPAPLPALGPAQLAAPSDDAVTAAVQRFFDAYLAGRGSPGAGLSPVTPPYASATVVAMAAGPVGPSGVRTVRAQLAATDAVGLKVVLDYSLQLAQHNGTWAVTALLPVPPLLRRYP
jgi:hypothetical protein